MTPPDTLAMDYLQQTYSLRLGKIALKKYCAPVRKLGGFLRRPPTIADLDDQTLAEFALHLSSCSLAPLSVRVYTAQLRAIGRHARGEHMQRQPYQPPISKLSRAAVLFVRGASFEEIATELGVCSYTVRKWRCEFPDIWKAAVEQATTSALEVMRQKIGDEVLSDPASYLRMLPNGSALIDSLQIVAPGPDDDAQLEVVLDQLLLERAIANATSSQYRRSVRKFSLFLGKPARLEHLNYQQVNHWLRSLEGKCAPRTIRNMWRGVCAIWHFAAETRGLEPPHPRRIRRCKMPPSQPTIWTPDELQRLLAAAHLLPWPIHGINTGALLRSLALVDYCTALRRVDLLNVRFEQLQNDAIVTLQQKTNQLVYHWLDEAALRSIEAIRTPDRERIYPVSKSWLAKWWDRLLAKAGLPQGRREGPQKLRRTSATAVAVEHGMDAAGRHLGHLTPGLAAKHYVPWIALGRRQMPPPIDALLGNATKKEGAA